MVLAATQQPACLADHATLKSTPALWQSLELIGTSRIEADEFGPALVIEMRNCSCHSTLALELS